MSIYTEISHYISLGDSLHYLGFSRIFAAACHEDVNENSLMFTTKSKKNKERLSDFTSSKFCNNNQLLTIPILKTLVYCKTYCTDEINLNELKCNSQNKF